MPEEFVVEIDSPTTTVVGYRDNDNKPKTYHEIYLVDKSGNALQLFQAKRGEDNPCIFISQFESIVKLGNTNLDGDTRRQALKLKDDWQIMFHKGYVVTRRDIQHIKTITEEMRNEMTELLEIKEDGFKERIKEIKRNADDKVTLANEQLEQYRKAIISLSKESADAETQNMVNMIEIVAHQAQARRGKMQVGSRTFATSQAESQDKQVQTPMQNKDQPKESA